MNQFTITDSVTSIGQTRLALRGLDAGAGAAYGDVSYGWKLSAYCRIRNYSRIGS